MSTPDDARRALAVRVACARFDGWQMLLSADPGRGATTHQSGV